MPRGGPDQLGDRSCQPLWIIDSGFTSARPTGASVGVATENVVIQSPSLTPAGPTATKRQLVLRGCG